MSLDISAPLRTAIVNNLVLAGSLGVWLGEPAVFTRRPFPDDAEAFPQIGISPNVVVYDQDALARFRPVVMRDIAVYGREGAPGEDDYRSVEGIAIEIRDLFHRQRWAIDVPGYHVIDIVAAGPSVAPVDRNGLVGRVVTLTARLQKL